MHAHASAQGPVANALRVQTELMIQRGRAAALLLAFGLAIAFGDDRSAGVTLAVSLLAGNVIGVWSVLRHPRGRQTVIALGWWSFLADAAVCGLALAAVADDPIDPISAIAVMVALEAAIRWGTRGAVLGGLLAGGMAVAWAASGYDAIGRELPATSIVFRWLSLVVIALPVGLLIERLQRQRDLTRRLFDNSRDAIIAVNHGRVVAANPATSALVGLPIEQLLDAPFTATLGGVLELEDPDALVAHTDEPHRVPINDAEGRVRWIELRAEHSQDAGMTFVIGRDITEERIREEELTFRAWHDPLTGLGNRAALRSRLGGRLAEGGSVGVLFLDLDGFKRVNDDLGHVWGDALLVEIADRLRGVTRETDAAYRWGGDEFCLVIDPATSERLEMIGGRIDEAFRRGFRIGSGTAQIHASIGTALAQPGDTETALINRADERMYASRDGGRDGSVHAG